MFIKHRSVVSTQTTTSDYPIQPVVTVVLNDWISAVWCVVSEQKGRACVFQRNSKFLLLYSVNYGTILKKLNRRRNNVLLIHVERCNGPRSKFFSGHLRSDVG